MTAVICATSSTRVRARRGCFPALPPSDSSGVTSPSSQWYAAGITAVRHEDCGPCTQLGVTMAERAGVNPAVLRAVLTDNPNAMPPDVALVWNFTRATLAHDAAADEYRDAIARRWGRRALISLAFAIAAARICARQIVDERASGNPGGGLLLERNSGKCQRVEKVLNAKNDGGDGDEHAADGDQALTRSGSISAHRNSRQDPAAAAEREFAEDDRP